MADRTALRDPPACEDRGVPIAVAELARCAPALIEVFTADQAEALAAHLTCLHLAANAVVVTEGARDRTMYVVVDGEAVARRGGVEVARMRAGEHFGELSLLVEAPRAATVTARGPLTVAALDLDAYHALATAHPAVALRLVEWIVAGVRTRLTEVSDSLSMLLRERSLPRRARVAVTVSGKPRTVATGVTAGALLPATVDGLPVVAALIDRRPVSLGERISSPCAIAPVTPASAEGERIHRRGLALLLLEAAHRIAPGLQLAFGHSLGFGQRVAVRGVGHDELVELAGALERELAALVAADLPVREELWYVEEAREYFTEAGWTEVSALLELWLGALVPVSTFGQVHALALDPPGPSAGALGGARVLVEDGELLLAYPPASAARPMDDDELRRTRAILQRMTSAQDRWLGALGIDSVGAFNRACVGGRVSELIRVAEGYHEKRVSEIADQIRASGARVVAIAGPSSSGKTTFIKRLHTQLQVLGVTPFELSLDDYYVDRERTPRDASGEYDFEAFDALEVELLTHHLGALCAGQEVELPRYDFQRGASVRATGRRARLTDGDVLLVEGIHGLNPRLAELVPTGAAFAIFVCPLAQLPFDRLSRVHTSDVRLLRRIVRDRHGRGHDAASSIARWASVRAGERRHIFPYQDRADAVFDTSLIYELSVLKVYAQRYLLEVPSTHPSYTMAYRLQQLLERFVPIYPDHVPPTSILREFIGASGFEY
jgi:uridine kinase